jgi:hypothetical protein
MNTHFWQSSAGLLLTTACATAVAVPSAATVRKHETELVVTQWLEETNLGASRLTEIPSPSARVKQVRCVSTSAHAASCTYLTDNCDGDEPLHGEWCSRMTKFSRDAGGRWAAVAAAPGGGSTFRLPAHAVKEAFALMEAGLTKDPDASYHPRGPVRYSSAKCTTTDQAGVAECKLRMTYPNGKSREVQNTFRRSGTDRWIADLEL